MKAFLKIVAALLLLFNGIGAIYGGGNLILHPDGSSIELSPVWLEHTPFPDYLIPGIVLFIANGLSSMFVLATLLLNLRNYHRFVLAQGIVLVGWIVIQIILIQMIYFLHGILGGVGVALIILGWLLKRSANAGKSPDAETL